MKFIFLLLFSCSLCFSFGQTIQKDTGTVLQDISLTNIDNADILEIKEAKQVLTDHFLKIANIRGSYLNNLIKESYKDLLDNGHNNSKRETRYPEKISANNLLISFINKDFAQRCTVSSTDTSLFDCHEERQYNFLITIPYYDGHSHGYEIGSFSFNIYFVKWTSWKDGKGWKAVTPKKTEYKFYKAKKTNIVYPNLNGEGDLEK